MIITPDPAQGVGAYTNITPYALGYVVLGYALQAQLSVIHLRSSNGRNVIAPSVSSVEFALAELGLDFGNTGEDAARLTADIQGAQVGAGWAGRMGTARGHAVTYA